ncbi:hypothetical protein [Clostridium botulinum]|uniref:hypothetical protein n=1 Tax=Clostridium botulinum TaxID=1491 RepID=UPI00192A59D9|nr:hypothetical protein [Clostridium botulinum]
MAEVKVTEVSEEEKEKQKMQMFFTSLASLVVNDLNENNKKNSFFKKYKKQDVIDYLQNPQKYEKELREISRFLYVNSAHYKRLINYFANMSLFYYDFKPTRIIDFSKINKKKFLKEYYTICSRIDKMNLSHEFSKILTIAFKEDIFYGYEYETTDSYFIKNLDPDYCSISSIEDGVYNYQFDFTFFDNRKEKLKEYGKEFEIKYNKYLKDRKSSRYQELNSQKTICIKINEEIEYPIPPFANVFEALYDINDYKLLKKAKEEIGNYQLLSMNIPMSDKEPDAPMLDFTTAKEFYAQALNVLPDQIGAILTPMKIDSIKFERDTLNNDRVIEAEDLFWSSAGVNGNLFNSKGNSGSVVDLSIKTDESIVFKVLKQGARWVNRKFKFAKTQFMYKFSFLDVTINNQEKMIDKYFKLAQYGIPVKTNLCSLVGLSPIDMQINTWLENDVLKLHENWLPLNSSHTQTNEPNSEDKKAGKPQTNAEDLQETGEQTRENDSNNDRIK